MCLVLQARLGVITIVTMLTQHIAMSVTCIASNIGSYRYCEYAMMDMLTQLAYCDVGLVLRAALGVIGIVNTQTWQA